MGIDFLRFALLLLLADTIAMCTNSMLLNRSVYQLQLCSISQRFLNRR
jgi:hypothetical protein